MLMCYHNTVRNTLIPLCVLYVYDGYFHKIPCMLYNIPRCVLYIYDGYVHNISCMLYKKGSHDVHTTLFTTSIHSLNISRVSILLTLLVLLVSNGYVQSEYGQSLENAYNKRMGWL